MAKRKSEFARAGTRIKAFYAKQGKKVKLSAKRFNTLKKRQAFLKKNKISKVSTTKGGTRKTSRKAYTGVKYQAKRMSNKKMAYYKISAGGKKTRISKAKYQAAKKRGK